jgi:hypothetical protein
MKKIKKKKKPVDIFKTFEIFNKESLTVLRDKLIDIVMLETDNIFARNNLFNVDFKKDNSVQITVINDRETYDLLSHTWQRHKKKLDSVKSLATSEKQ